MKIRLKYLVNMLIIVAMAIISFTPIISRNQPAYWMPFLFLIWCISASYTKSKKIDTQPSGPLFWMIMFIVWQWFLSIIGINDANIWGLLVKVPKYGVVIIMVFVITNYRIREKKLLLVLLCAVFLINVLQNDVYAFGHPEYYKGLNRNAVLLKSTNLGSTPMVVCCLFFFPVILSMMTEVTSKRLKFLFVGIMVIIGYFFYVLNSRGIAFFLSLLFFWEYFIAARFSKKKHHIGYFAMISISAYLIYLIALNPLMSNLLGLFSENENLVERFSEIQNYSSTGEGDGSLGSRLFLYGLSIKTWLSSPINFLMGVGYHEYDTSLTGLIRSGVGHHSEFLDTLAYYGIIGGVILYKWLYTSFKFVIIKMKKTAIYNKYIVIVVAFVLHIFLNYMLESMETIMMCFLIVPLFFDILNTKIYERFA